MTSKTWAVWSLDERSGRWLVSNEGPRELMEEAAARVEANRVRLGLDGAYVALPLGQEPGPEHLPQPEEEKLVLIAAKSEQETNDGLAETTKTAILEWLGDADPAARLAMSDEDLATGISERLVDLLRDTLDEAMIALAKVSAVRNYMRFASDPKSQEYGTLLDEALAPFFEGGQ